MLKERILFNHVVLGRKERKEMESSLTQAFTQKFEDAKLSLGKTSLSILFLEVPETDQFSIGHSGVMDTIIIYETIQGSKSVREYISVEGELTSERRFVLNQDGEIEEETVRVCPQDQLKKLTQQIRTGVPTL